MIGSTDYEDGPSIVMCNSLSNHVPSNTMIRGTNGLITWEELGKGKSGIRIVPFAEGKEEIRIPWAGMGDTSKLWKNLLDCVKTREKPFSDIQTAVRVQAPLSMGVISHRENKVVLFDAETQTFTLN